MGAIRRQKKEVTWYAVRRKKEVTWYAVRRRRRYAVRRKKKGLHGEN
jgi:hypothetical protein